MFPAYVFQNHSNSFILELTIVTHFADLSLNVNITTMVRRYFSMRFLSVVWEKTTTTLMIHQMIYLGVIALNASRDQVPRNIRWYTLGNISQFSLIMFIKIGLC